MPDTVTGELMYLIWSNDARSWWGPGGHGYRGDVWDAGRFTRADAIDRCSMRTWKPGLRTAPPEVPVPAPENGGATFTVEQIRQLPKTLDALAAQATVDAMDVRSRARQACAWCRGGEPPTACTCAFKCGYGGCCSQCSPGRRVFDLLTQE